MEDLGDYFCSQSKKIVVSINSKINDDLFYEGITRDLIRHIQNLRKESLFNVDDRIKLIVDLPIDLIVEAIVFLNSSITLSFSNIYNLCI